MNRKMNNNNVVIIYSPDFILRTALIALQRVQDRNTCSVDSVETLFDEIIRRNPTQLILDIPAREHAYLFCAIRRKYPELQVIVPQQRHLFSDYVVAFWFGNIWLREYDSLMNGYPLSVPTSCITDSAFSGVESVGGACRMGCQGRQNGTQMLPSLQLWLEQRLKQRLSSRKAIMVVQNWLELGGTADDVGQRLACSKKLVYHYRRLVMRELGIRNTALELIPSVKVMAGDVPAECLFPCKVF